MKKVYLIVLDGFGIAPASKGNAVTEAKTPYIDELLATDKIAELKSHGHAVGLPDFQMGGSEVGHLTIGAGRPVKHVLTKINDEIESGSFFEKENLKNLFTKAKDKGRIHFVGMVSDGGIHSFLPHLFGLGKMAEKFGIPQVYVHPFLDGRDVPERTAENYLKQIEEHNVGNIATMGGRFFAMDRDDNWERTEKEYNVLTKKSADFSSADWRQHLKEYYANTGTSDYYFPPKLLLPEGQIQEDDIVICFNFRTDRMRQVMAAFCDSDFDHFQRDFICNPDNFGVFGNYYEQAQTIFSLSTEKIQNTLGEVVSDNNLNQLRIAETEKYNHVTFFFSGEQKAEFPNEDRILIPSPKAPSYATVPEMSAYKITEAALKKIREKNYELVVHNYANGDLVGHSADLQASIKAVEVLEDNLKTLVPAILKEGYHVIITADHGNCEEMLYHDGTPCPSHSKNLVPFRILSPDDTEIHVKKSGNLADVAPTVLELFEIKKPAEMTGKSLIE